MFIQIDPGNKVPVYGQIVTQIKFAVASGAYGPGDQIPSVRQLSVDLLVNPNTISKAYRELDREGIIFTKRGLGLFVTDEAPRICRRDRKAIISAGIEQALREAVQAELAPEEIKKIVESALQSALRERT